MDFRRWISSPSLLAIIATLGIFQDELRALEVDERVQTDGVLKIRSSAGGNDTGNRTGNGDIGKILSVDPAPRPIPGGTTNYNWVRVDFATPTTATGWVAAQFLSSTTPATFAGSSPGEFDEDDAESVDLDVELKWVSQLSASFYGVYVSKHPFGESNIVWEKEGIEIDFYAQGEIEIPAGKLQPNTLYRWDMRSFNGNHVTNYSSNLYFRTEQSKPNKPGQIRVTLFEGSIIVGWVQEKPPAVEGYRLQRSISGENDWTTIFNEDQEEQAFVDSGANDGTTWDYRVRAFNDAGNSSYSDIYTVETTPPVDLPIITEVEEAPLSLTSKSKWITIIGENFDEDFEAEVQLPKAGGGFDAYSPSSSRRVFNDDDEVRIKLPSLQGEGLLRIRIINPNGSSPFFSVDVGDNLRPVLVSPEDGSTEINPQGVTLEWENSNGGSVVETILYISAVSSYGAVEGLPTPTSLSGSTSSAEVSGLQPNQVYLWTVRFRFDNDLTNDRWKSCWFETGENGAVGDSRFEWADVSTTMTEGDSTSRIGIIRHGPKTSEETVEIIVGSGPAEEGIDKDFRLLSTELTFPPGKTRGEVLVTALLDTLNEGSESATLQMVNSSIPIRGSPSIVIEILDPSAEQQRTITGTVLNENGNPVAGTLVSLQSSGASRTTTTNTNGSYSFANVLLSLKPNVSLGNGLPSRSVPRSCKIRNVSQLVCDFVVIAGAVVEMTSGNSNVFGVEALKADPVHLGTGAQVISWPLLTLSGARSLPLSLHYNSLQSANAGTCGHGWTHNFEAKLTFSSGGAIEYHLTPNLIYSFSLSQFGNGTLISNHRDMRYAQMFQNEGGDWVIEYPDSSCMIFNDSGQYIRSKNSIGQILALTHTEGRLERVTEPVSGMYFQFSYLGSSLASISTNTGRAFTFDIQNNYLQSVNNPEDEVRHFSYTDEGWLDTSTDHEGRLLFDNVHDPQGRVKEQEDGRNDNLAGTFVYSVLPSENRQTVYTDRAGHSTTYELNKSYDLVRITAPDETVIQQGFDDAGNKEMVMLPGQPASTYDYTSGGAMSVFVDPAGNSASVDFDGSTNPLEFTSRLGETLTFEYGENNTLEKVTDELDRETSIRYSSGSLPVQTEHPDGNCTDVEFVNGLVQFVDDPLKRRTHFGYDVHQRVSSVTNAEGETVTITRDLMDRVVEYMDAENNVWKFDHDSHGNVVEIITPEEDEDNPGEFLTWTIRYDGNRNLETVTDPLGHTTTRGYDGEDRLIWMEDELDRRTTLRRNSKGWVEAVIDAESNEIVFTHDDAGNRETVTDSIGNLIQDISYNDLNLPTDSSNAEGRLNTFHRTSGLQLESSERPDLEKTQYFYDDLNRLDYTLTPMLRKVRREYDALGNLHKIFNEKEDFTEFQRNANGEVESIFTPLRRETKFDWDDAGRLETITRQDLTERTFIRDDRGHVTTDRVDGGADRVTAIDEMGRAESVTEGAHSVNWTFTKRGEVETYRDHFGDTVEYTYWPNRLLKTIQYEPGKTVTYVWNSRNLLESVTDWLGNETAYTYFDNHQISAITYPNGLVETRTYNLIQELTDKVITRPGGEVVYYYNLEHNVNGLLEEETRNPVSLTEAELEKFPVLGTYGTFDFDNRFLTLNDLPVSHDGRGNILGFTIDGNPQQFTYTARDELDSVGAVSYSYNADGELVTTSKGALSTSYLLDGASPYRSVLRSTRSDLSQPTYFVRGPGFQYEITGTSHRSYTFDVRGSTKLITDQAGVIDNFFDYSTYGSITQQLKVPTTPFLYDGEYGVRTGEGGMLYMRARHYNPSLGRFMSQDPAGIAGGLNLYAYAGGDPVGFVDPFGLTPTAAWVQAPPFYVQFSNGIASQILGGFSDNYLMGQSVLLAAANPVQTLKKMGGMNYWSAGVETVRNASQSIESTIHSSMEGDPYVLGQLFINVATVGISKVGATVRKFGDGIVYNRLDPKTGESYVGQTISPKRFNERKGEHDRDLGVQHEYEILGRADSGLDLDVLEESMIRKNGGLQKEGGSLVNKRHQMSDKRYRNSGGTVPDPNN